MKKVEAIILLSGGLDSALILAKLSREKKKVLALSFDYNQRHRVELDYAKRLAEHYGAVHQIFKIDPQAVCHTPLASKQAIPKDRTLEEIEAGGVATTFVPARNTIFISYALGQAELRGADEIYFGPNAHDKYGYPDTSQEYVQAFQNLIDTQGPFKLICPLINMTKTEIRRKAESLGVPIDMTFSCYDPTPEGKHCRRCDACMIRFSAA